MKDGEFKKFGDGAKVMSQRDLFSRFRDRTNHCIFIEGWKIGKALRSIKHFGEVSNDFFLGN